jgi:hypothetical protein
LPLLQVLFDDIGQSLIRLSSQDLQFQLIEAFLQFLGVPSGFVPPASCLYLAMDESSIFDNGLPDEKPLTYFSLSFSGISSVGHMDQLGCPRWTQGHNREGEEFIRNVFYLVMPLFSGKQKSHLCFSWLRYEIEKVTPVISSLLGAFSFHISVINGISRPRVLLGSLPLVAPEGTMGTEGRGGSRSQSGAQWPELSVVWSLVSPDACDDTGTQF